MAKLKVHMSGRAQARALGENYDPSVHHGLKPGDEEPKPAAKGKGKSKK